MLMRWLCSIRTNGRDFLPPAKASVFAPALPMRLVRHEPSKIDADITFGALAFEQEAIERATRIDIAGVSVPLATPEDLIVMKAVAHRARDIADIESLLDAHPTLDYERIRRWVREFSTVLQSPPLLDYLERLLANK